MNGTYRAAAMRGAAPGWAHRAALGLALALIFALLAAVPPATAHAAEEGAVAIGVTVANGDAEEAAGAAGEVSLGVAVGQEAIEQKYPDPITRPGAQGEVPIGIAVGYDVKAGKTVEVSFDAGKGSFPGGESLRSGRVPRGSRAVAPPEPKRPGWSFAGWKLEDAGWAGAWDPEGTSAVPLAGAAWDFDAPVKEDTVLHAEWSLRLDVTVPVAVGFGVNMNDDGEGFLRQTIAPEEGAYALKSRTVREVSVEGLATETREEDAGAFFELSDDVLFDGMTEEDGLWAWTDALGACAVALTGEGETVRVYLAGDEGWEEVGSRAVWGDATALTESEREAFTVPAFAYGGSVPEADPAWQGQERCERLPLAIALQVPKRALDVKNGIDGPKPITRLKLTVSARAERGM